MIHLDKITLGFDEVEDRLFLRCSVKNSGEVLRLWLTQRFMKLLLSHLHKRLARLVEPQIAVAVEDGSMAGKPSLEMPKAVEAVDGFVCDELIRDVDIKNDERHVQLIFKQSKHHYSLVFDAVALNQWLRTLSGVAVNAGWLVDADLNGSQGLH